MTVERLLSELSGRKILALLNRGNKGDGLVHMGGRRLFQRCGVRCEEIRHPRPAEGEVLLVYGCGAFSRPYHHMVDFLELYRGRFARVVILPASFDVSCARVRDFLTGLPPNFVVFCRERYSFDDVRAVVPRLENVHLDHDLAFRLDFAEWARPGAGRLLAFRTDAEGPPGVSAPGNNDVSAGDEAGGECLLRDVARYAEVHTNRAHVAIAAAMMGKRTFVYPSIYHKQKGIFEYSLAHLPHVSWRGQNGPSPEDCRHG